MGVNSTSMSLGECNTVLPCHLVSVTRVGVNITSMTLGECNVTRLRINSTSVSFGEYNRSECKQYLVSVTKFQVIY